MPSYTKPQTEAIERGLGIRKISLGEGGHLLRNGKVIDDDGLDDAVQALVHEINNNRFTRFADIIEYLEYKNRPAKVEGGPSMNEIATDMIREKIGVVWSDWDGSFHYLPVGDQRIGRIVPFDELEVLVKNGVINYNEGRDREGRIFAPNVLTCMEDMQIRARNKKLTDISITLGYDNNGSLDRWVRSLYEFWHIEQDYDVFSTMFRQWMWCVKRRFSSMTATNEIMVNIYGSQGSGKTIPITRLLNKVFTQELWSKIRIDTVMDERQHFLWSSKAVLMLDELQGDHVSGAALGAFKEMITADTVNYRILGQNKEMSSCKTACMIGTSNFHLFKRLNDSSGMRRFIEFDIDPNAPRIPESQWLELVDTITDGAVAAFKDIDIDGYGYWIPDSDNPAVKETNKKIRRIQESYVDENPTIKWLKDTYIMDSTITKRNATIKVGNITTPGTVMFDYNNNWMTEHDRYDSSGKIKVGKSMAEKIVEAFGPDAVYSGKDGITKLVRIDTPESSGVIDPMRDIATPVGNVPDAFNATPFAEFE